MAKLAGGRCVLMVAVVAATAGIWSPGAQAATLPQAPPCPQPIGESLSELSLQPVQSPAEPWAQQQLNPNRVWPLTTGAGVKVAVVDSGVNARYPALAHAVEPGEDMVQQDQPADYDCVGHGTLVAGIIAARPQPGTGFEGIAPGATILPVRQTETGQPEANGAELIAEAIDYAVSHGASVINISIAATGTNSDLASAVRYALSNNVVITRINS